MRRLIGGFLCLVLFSYSVKSDVYVDYKLGKNTKIVNNDFKFSDLDDGDILIYTDNGGKILKVISTKNGEIKTTDATMEEAFEYLEVKYSNTLKESDIKSVKYNYDFNKNNKDFKLNLNNLVVYDYDNNSNTKDDRIILDGVFNFIPGINWNIKIEDHRIKELFFEGGVDEKSDFKITISTPLRIPIPFSKEFELCEYEFNHVIVGPVVFTPIIKVVAAFNVGVAGKVMININQKVKAKYNAFYDGNWKSNAEVLDKSFNGGISFIGADGWLKVYTGPRFKLNFYSRVGPYLEGFGYLKTTAKTNTLKPLSIKWDFYGGFEANCGISVNLFSWFMKDFEKNIIDKSYLIKSGCFGCENKNILVKPVELETDNNFLNTSIYYLINY